MRELCPTCSPSLPPRRPREMPAAPWVGPGEGREGTSLTLGEEQGSGGPRRYHRPPPRGKRGKPPAARQKGRGCSTPRRGCETVPRNSPPKKKKPQTAPQRQLLAPSTSCASGPGAAPSSRSEIPALPAAPGGPPAPAPPPSIARAHWSAERGPPPPSRPARGACWEA